MHMNPEEFAQWACREYGITRQELTEWRRQLLIGGPWISPSTFRPIAEELIQSVFPTDITYIRNLGSSYDPSTGDGPEHRAVHDQGWRAL